ncbi:MAG TPA: MarR family transcriptional regulator [Chloroflexota bacterium]
MTDLGQRAGLSKQTMTTMIRLMEERGLVERRPDPLDRRAARIFLTERSQAFKKVAGQALEVMDTLVKSQIGADQIDSARDVLKVIARLGRH